VALNRALGMIARIFDSFHNAGFVRLIVLREFFHALVGRFTVYRQALCVS
jgi:hypothetical protein